MRATRAESNRKYNRTKNGVVSRIFGDQKGSSKRRGHNPPSYSKAELMDWMYSQTIFHELFNAWKSGGYIKRDKPSCDRVDDSKGYSLQNIVITTWGENDSSAYEDKRNGVLKSGKALRPVIGTLRSGAVINYKSVGAAAQAVGVKSSNISDACAGRTNTSGGMRWEYADNQKK